MAMKWVAVVLALAIAAPASADPVRRDNDDAIWRDYAWRASAALVRARSSPEENIKLTGMYQIGDYETVLKVTPEITNANDFAVQDFTIACDMIGNSGSVIRTIQNRLYERLAAHETRKFQRITVGYLDPQMHYPKCRITGAVVLFGR